MNALQLHIANLELTSWQKKQAAMLYYFASLDYIKNLHRMVTNLIDGVVDPLLILAKIQNRDPVLVDPQWGTRNTTENWSNNAWPFLKEYQASLAKNIAGRAFERYEKTGTNDCFRGISEYSMRWATVEEEQTFDDIVRAISSYANMIDNTLDDYQGRRWTDYGLTIAYKKFAQGHPKISRFQIRPDVCGESGKAPHRTGVYVSQDDSNAALQFAWTGKGGGKLRAAKTFNEIGLTALRTVGRENLWINDEKMFEFAMKSSYVEIFRPTIYMLGEEHRDFSSFAISDVAYVDRPCKWFFVEAINGEFEDIDKIENIQRPNEPVERIPGGETCVKAGFYFTPARANSRQHFSVNQLTPKYDSQYGITIWQWDENQE